MFDVSWADPMRETVGQRKNRKDQGSSGSARSSPVHITRSSESSSTQPRPSVLNILGGKKESLSRARSQSKLFSSCAEDPVEASTTTSNYNAGSEGSDRELSSLKQFPGNGFFTEGPDGSDTDQCSLSDASGSVFSGRTDRSHRTNSIWTMAESTTSSERIVQPLGPRSYVTRCTEVTVSRRESVEASEQMSTFVHISAANTIPMEDFECATSISPSTTFDFPVSNFNQSDRASPNTFANHKEQFDSHPSGWSCNMRGRQLNSWKPPETWQCPLDEPDTPDISLSTSLELPLQPEEKQAVFTKEMIGLQRSIKIMESASQDVVLQHLKEELVGGDASASLGLELKKTFWMLSALRRQSASSPNLGSAEPPAPKAAKILSLYENYAFSSFLSVVTAAPEIHHLSSTPLSSELNTKIWPLSVPSPSSRLPYATGIFTDIHAFPLPALLPASLIPQLLKECHRTLTSSIPYSPTYSEPIASSTTRGGKLHLAILNPSPLINTLGPRLRDWLDNHLILNLERQFRCINPGRLIPIWLANAGLRGAGTSILSTIFFACVPPKLPSSPKQRSSRTSRRSAESEVDQVEITNEELKSVIGRMLWKEMWGSFLEGEEWWWDDESIVEECENRGTCWEYSIIEAVKEG